MLTGPYPVSGTIFFNDRSLYFICTNLIYIPLIGVPRCLSVTKIPVHYHLWFRCDPEGVISPFTINVHGFTRIDCIFTLNTLLLYNRYSTSYFPDKILNLPSGFNLVNLTISFPPTKFL